MRLLALVVEEAWQARVLRDRGRGRISSELACELLLQPFDRVVIEANDTPEQVDVIRRRVEHVAEWRKISTGGHARQDSRPIAVGVEEDVANGADGVARAGPTTGGDRVHTDEDAVLAGIHCPKPSL